MRIPVIAGNWKMNKTWDEALEFVYKVSSKMPSETRVETVIGAPSPLLRGLVKRQGDHLKIAAQTMHESNSGAYTGEISAPLLESINVSYVILGHSERRAYYNETDEAVNLKTIQALKYDLTPIVCIGESLEVRENNQTMEFVAPQVEKALKDIKEEDLKKVILAYEPIWAIGTGKSATNEMANETIKQIREQVRKLKGDVADNIRILYGGSVKPATIEGLMSESDIDGALIGGASLDANDYIDMVEKVLNL